MPRNWWATLEMAAAVIESEAVWPAASPRSNGTFTPLDVDRHQNLAIVVGYGPTRLKGDLALGVDEFHELETGQWSHLGGAASGTPLHQRRQLQDGRQELHIRLGGHAGKFLFEERPQYSYSVFLCGPDVASVQVQRSHGIRTADVSSGPGWLAVLWTPDDPAIVSAFTADGTQTFTWRSSPSAG
jgi:hypothetical protein